MKRRLIYLVFIPLILGAVGFLAYSSFTTTFNFDVWGVRTIVDSTYIVAREKAQRIEQKIIDSDNAFLSLVDMDNLEDLKTGWDRFSGVSHAVDSVYVIDQNRSVIFSVSDYADPEHENLAVFFQDVITPMLELQDGKTTTLRHLHVKHEGRYVLISYKSRMQDGAWYTVCLNYNIDYLKDTFLPEMLADLTANTNFNVVDMEGNLIYGSRIKGSGEFIVGWKIPSTLYEWRIQVAPTQASYYEATSRRKHLYDSITVGLAFGVVFLGIGMLIYMTEQERRLGRLKSEFIANVSHELKTPLSIIRLFSDMLALGKISDPDKARRYLETISREGERLTTLIDNVLDFARMERGKLAYRMEEGDITPAVMSAVELARFKFEQQRMGLEVHVDDALPAVPHDPHAITLAILNLLDNAVTYAEGSDKVAVTVTESRNGGAGGRVAISVRDWGPGVPKNEQKQIFERFFRGEKAREKHKRGTGIGLTLVKSIIESHGGRVQIHSPLETSGRGTEFLITL
jgi:two-component system phosphate regulon sensor histidine kinase PhoR